MSCHITQEKKANKIGHEVAPYQTNVAMTAVTFDKHTFDDMPSQVDNRQAKKGMCYGRFYQFHLCSSGFCGTQFLQRNKLTMWWSPKKKAVK